MYCGKCGATNPDNGKFCTTCGAVIGGGENDGTQQPAAQAAQSAGPINIQASASQPVGQQKASGGKNSKIILIATGVICLAAVCIIVALVLTGNNGNGTGSGENDVSTVQDITESGDSEVQDAMENNDIVYYLTREDHYNKEGTLLDWREYEYDVAGNQTSITYYGGDGSVNGWIEYEYDAAGNQMRETICSSAGYVWDRTEYEYDAAGNQISSTRYDSDDGSVDWWEEYEYDAAGNQINSTRYDSDGSRRTEYEYDATGNRISEIRYGSDGIVSERIEYEYGTR